MAADAQAQGRGEASLAERIVDTAIALAEEAGWDRVRLRRVAERLDVPLADVARETRDLDAVADAWFARARDAMLAPPARDFAQLAARKRVYLVLMRWFDALAAHRRVTGQMIAAKLYPAHPHHWVPLVFHLSRTVHWVREAALLDAAGRRRQIEEIGLTVLLLAALAVWLRDDSPRQESTRRFLRRSLETAGGWMARAWGRDAPRRTPDAAIGNLGPGRAGDVPQASR